MKERIITFLKLLHLYSVAKTVYHWFDPVLYFFRDIVRRKRFIRDMDRVCEEIASMNPEPGGILAFGILCTDHKPTLIPFLEQIQTAAQKPIMFLDESRNADMPCPFPRICIPRSAPVKYDAKLKLTPMPEMERLIQQNPCLHQALKNITARLNNIHPEYAKVLLYRSYMIYQLVLDRWKPSEVMIWNEFNPLHTVFTEVCREKGIDPIFMEFGVLPGTFAIERGGQMGRSLIARNAEEFLQKPVSQEELEQGREVLNFLRSSGLNRNAQPRNDEMDVLRAKLKPGRPIILFAGQHDFDSGLTPYMRMPDGITRLCLPPVWRRLTTWRKLLKKMNGTLFLNPIPVWFSDIDRKTYPPISSLSAM